MPLAVAETQELQEDLLSIMDRKNHWAWPHFNDGHATRPQLLLHFQQELDVYVRDFPVFLSRVHSRCPHAEVRQDLAENLFEEETGKLSKGVPHPASIRAFSICSGRTIWSRPGTARWPGRWCSITPIRRAPPIASGACCPAASTCGTCTATASRAPAGSSAPPALRPDPGRFLHGRATRRWTRRERSVYPVALPGGSRRRPRGPAPCGCRCFPPGRPRLPPSRILTETGSHHRRDRRGRRFVCGSLRARPVPGRRGGRRRVHGGLGG